MEWSNNERVTDTRDRTMRATWYCTDCDEQIASDDIEAHEDDGHTVRGAMQPDRLLGNDPWNLGLTYDPDDEEVRD